MVSRENRELGPRIPFLKHTTPLTNSVPRDADSINRPWRLMRQSWRHLSPQGMWCDSQESLALDGR